MDAWERYGVDGHYPGYEEYYADEIEEDEGAIPGIVLSRRSVPDYVPIDLVCVKLPRALVPLVAGFVSLLEQDAFWEESGASAGQQAVFYVESLLVTQCLAMVCQRLSDLEQRNAELVTLAQLIQAETIAVRQEVCGRIRFVTLTRLVTGDIGLPFTFRAAAPGDYAGEPTYTWTPAPASGQGTVEATYLFGSAGLYQVKVTVTTPWQSVSTGQYVSLGGVMARLDNASESVLTADTVAGSLYSDTIMLGSTTMVINLPDNALGFRLKPHLQDVRWNLNDPPGDVVTPTQITTSPVNFENMRAGNWARAHTSVEVRSIERTTGRKLQIRGPANALVDVEIW